MKLSNFRDFKSYLQRELSPVYLVAIADNFDRRKVVENILQRAPKELTSLEPETVTAGNISGEFQSLNLFSKQRTILIRRAEKLNKDVIKAIEEYFDNINVDFCVIIEASKINRATRLYKKADKIGVVLDFAEGNSWEKDNNFVSWMMEELSAYGKSIKPDVCFYLIKGIGHNKSLLYQELQKILCFVGERQNIVLDDVRAVSAVFPMETIWQLREALWRRDASNALRIARNIEYEILLVLLAQLRTQFQTGLHVSSLLGDKAAITKTFPYMKGRILENNIFLAQGYGLERFKKAIQAINNTEIELKNSSTDEKLLLEKLIMELVE